MNRHRYARPAVAAWGAALLALQGCAGAQSGQPASAPMPAPSRGCSDSAGAALYDGAPDRLLSSSGSIMPAPRCGDERWRALFLQLEAQRDLSRAALPGHDISVPQQPEPAPGR